MNTFEIKKPSTHHGLGRVVSRITSPARLIADVPALLLLGAMAFGWFARVFLN